MTTTTLPGVSSLIVPATAQYPRNSEGDLIVLKDGRMLYSWARKISGEDTAEGCVVSITSDPTGEHWSTEAKVIQPVWPDVADVMCVSLCRTPRGLHLFFIGRLANPPSGNLFSGCNRIFQLISTDEGETWGPPQPVSTRYAYTILNNGRVIRTSTGRLLVPVANVPGSIAEFYDEQRIYCLYSDDDGCTWHESNELAIIGTGLMEPGVAECSDGSIYMTIRTKTGFLYEARSHRNGAYWAELRQTTVASAEAPATVLRAPHTGDLWLLWCNTPYTGNWYDRNDIALAISKDNGRSWGEPITLEHHPDHSFAYISALIHRDALWVTYYDWPNYQGFEEKDVFHMTSVRLRKITLSELSSSLL